MKVGIAAGLLCAAAAALAACSVQKSSDGNQDSVSVKTPVGGMQVKSSPTKAVDVGLPVYPGAIATKSDSDSNNDSADIGFNFGKFRLKIQVASYESADSGDKILSFYRTALGKYGTVLACRGGKPVGQPTSAPSGLTCSDDVHAQGSGSGHEDGVELRAGDPHHFHMATVNDKVEGGNTKFALLNIELPHGDHGTD